MEKAQAIRLESCIPQNWWEFAVNYTVHVYNCTLLKRASNDYKTPFERLQRRRPDVAHLGVFGCGVYIFLPEDTRTNNLSPRSELMTFIGLSEGTKGYIFMRSPNNIVFTAIQALFDETLFPKCPNMCQPGYTPVGLTPDDHQGEHNIPPDDENEDHEGDFPQVPYRQITIPPLPPAQYYPPAPLSLKGKGRAFTPSDPSSMNKDPFGSAPDPDNEDMYMSRPMSPQVLPEPTPPVTPPRRNPIIQPEAPRQSYLDRTYQLQSPRQVRIPVFAPTSWPADSRHLNQVSGLRDKNGVFLELQVLLLWWNHLLLGELQVLGNHQLSKMLLII